MGSRWGRQKNNTTVWALLKIVGSEQEVQPSFFPLLALIFYVMLCCNVMSCYVLALMTYFMLCCNVFNVCAASAGCARTSQGVPLRPRQLTITMLQLGAGACRSGWVLWNALDLR